MTSHPTTPAVLFVCGLTLFTPRADAAAPAPSPVAVRIQESAAERVLFLLREQADAGHGVDPDLLAALRGPAHESPATVISTLLDGVLPPSEADAPPTPLNVYQRDLALEALSGIAPARVRPLLPRPAELRTDEDRLAAAMRVMAWTLPPGEAPELLALSRPDADPDGTVPLRSIALRRELRASLARAVAREPESAASLLRPLIDGHEGERAAILGALGDSGDARVLPVLLDALETRGVESGPVLEQVARLGRSYDRELDARLLERMRAELHVPEERTVSAAVRALTAFDDTGSIPDLVERLRWAEGSRGAIHAALRELSDVRLPDDDAVWERYLAAESTWAQGSLQGALDRLLTADAAELIGLVRAVTPHRLQRDDLAEALAVRLEDGYRPVRRASAAALAQLGSPLATEPLVAALEREPGEPTYAAALTRITGESLGAEPEAWRAWLASRRP